MILLNDFQSQWADVGAEASACFARVGAKGWYILGEAVKKFEADLAAYCGVKSSVGCANGLDAIEIGLRLLGIKEGDAVLTTPLSAFATTLAILRCNAVPVFCDVDSNGLLDLSVAERILTARPDIRFCVPVHLYGHSLDLVRLRALKDRFDLRIVEDCAQAIGARFNGVPVGTVGDVGALSFYPTKNLGCFGDGGAVLINDVALHSKALALRDYGQTSKYVHSVYGLNSRLDEVQAALLGEVLLPRLARFTARRQEIATRYCTEIENRHLTLPAPGLSSVWHLFPILVKSRRESFQDFLKSQGVQSAVHYPKLITDQEALTRGKRFECLDSLSMAHTFANSETSIPIHPYLSDADVSKVISACNNWAP